MQAIKEHTSSIDLEMGIERIDEKKSGHLRPGKQDTTHHGGDVSKREIGAGIEGSWIRRAVNEPPSVVSVGDESGSVVALVLGKADQGWDPRDVWLRRIDHPRRSHAELRHSTVVSSPTPARATSPETP